MTVQTGRAILLKLRKTSRDAYQSVAGIRAQSITLNANHIDITTADSYERWRQLLPESGVRDMRLQGQGLFSNAESDRIFREMFFEGTHPYLQIVLPNYGTISGIFAISELQYLGDYDGEMSWRIDLRSAGGLNFAAL